MVPNLKIRHIHRYDCIGKNTVYIGLDTICGFRHPCASWTYPLWEEGCCSDVKWQCKFSLFCFSEVPKRSKQSQGTGWEGVDRRAGVSGYADKQTLEF